MIDGKFLWVFYFPIISKFDAYYIIFNLDNFKSKFELVPYFLLFFGMKKVAIENQSVGGFRILQKHLYFPKRFFYH